MDGAVVRGGGRARDARFPSPKPLIYSQLPNELQRELNFA
jgi:hypothetical protein